jgi:hypothetical protein
MKWRMSVVAVVAVSATLCFQMSRSSVTLLAAQSNAAATLATGVVPTSPDPGYKLPRTAWGHPDLQGMWENSEEIGIPIEKPRGEVRKLVTQDDAFDEADKRGGPTGAGPRWWYETKPFNGRTYQLIDPPDGRLPPLTPWATEKQAEARKNRGGPADSYLSMGVATRCLTRGIPGSMVPGYFMYNAGYRFIQTPTQVIIQYEMIHDVRIIPLDGRPHPGPNIRTWFGDARGHWEGNTLVVETTNLNDSTPLLGSGLSGPGTNEQTRVIERFTRITDGLIRFEATIDNPKVFTKPWTIAIPLKRDDSYQIFEYACHEGNKGVVTVLSGAREEEKTEKAARSGRPGSTR